jgi:hypothetical protein
MGGNNDAQKQARREESARQKRIGDTTARIDATFDAPARQAQYDAYAQALRAQYQQDAARQKAIADRALKFSMARGGLTGGSVAADTGAGLRDEYTRGILDAEGRTQGGVADLRSADQQSRLNLIQLANAGTDTTSALANAGAAMRANIDTARATGRGQGLGDIFASTRGVYERQREEAGRRRSQAAIEGYYARR